MSKSDLRLGEVWVSLADRVLANGFEEHQLSRRFSVTVPTLVEVRADDEIRKLYTLSSERRRQAAREMRLVAHCIGHEDECSYLNLFSQLTGEPVTTFFVPKDGLQLHKFQLPFVISHTFGAIGAAMLAGDLYREVKEDPAAGVVFRT